MKNNHFTVLLFLFLTHFATAQTSKGQMGGVWYCSETKEIFAITTDDNNTIQGRGVYYAKGDSKFKQMQIMTQTTTEEGYLMRCYDPSKPNMVYELKSAPATYGVKITFTKTGSRSKKNYLYNLNLGVPDTKGYGKMKPWEIVRRTLYTGLGKKANAPIAH